MVFPNPLKLLIHPFNFFDELKSKNGTLTAFIYYFFISLFSSVIPLIKYFIIVNIEFYRSYLYLSPVSNPILVFLGLLFLSFIIAVIFHLFVSLIGGKKKFSDSYKIFAYSSTPLLVIYPIIDLIFPLDIVYPGFGIFYYCIFGLYFAYLFFLGFYKIYELSKVKLVLLIIFGIIFYIVLTIIGMMISFR